jgi:hypothetical protein
VWRATAASLDAGLPNIAQFQTNRSDRFLVDLQYVWAGHPFKGRRALEPHQGAHVHWNGFGRDGATEMTAHSLIDSSLEEYSVFEHGPQNQPLGKNGAQRKYDRLAGGEPPACQTAEKERGNRIAGFPGVVSRRAEVDESGWRFANWTNRRASAH